MNEARIHERIEQVNAEIDRLYRIAEDRALTKEEHALLDRSVGRRDGLQFALGRDEAEGTIWSVWHEGHRLFNLAEPSGKLDRWQFERGDAAGPAEWETVQRSGLSDYRPKMHEVAMWFVAHELAVVLDDSRREPVDPETVMISRVGGGPDYDGNGKHIGDTSWG